jgi:hypothetical protein
MLADNKSEHKGSSLRIPKSVRKKGHVACERYLRLPNERCDQESKVLKTCGDFIVPSRHWNRLLKQIANKLGSDEITEEKLSMVEIPRPDFSNIYAYEQSTQPYDLFRKGLFSKEVPAEKLEVVTLQTALRCEQKNRVTNGFFTQLSPYPVSTVGKSTADFWWDVKTELKSLFSDFSPFKTFKYCNHGKGASENSQSPLWKKYKNGFSVTRDIAATLAPIYEELEGYLPNLVITNCDRFEQVPKTSKTNRPIGVQPTLNLYFQIGLGSWMKTALASKWGLNLFDQSRNRALARLGSLYGLLATMDLSSASDLISREVVRFLFEGTPILDYMEKLRTPYTDYGSAALENEKFSAMGNGFTFELETAIFAAIVRVVYKQRNIPLNYSNHSVYGDDIICYVEMYDDIVYRLKQLGFEVNEEKSFKQGHFLESCGEDYYRGNLVRSYYSKEDHNCDQNLESVLRFTNGLYRKAISLCGDESLHLGYMAAWRSSLAMIPRCVRKHLSGPVVDHDAWLITNDSVYHSKSYTNRLGNPVRLAWISSSRQVKSDQYFCLDTWYYLANRRSTLTGTSLGRNSLCKSRNLYGLQLYNSVGYTPSSPGRHQLNYIADEKQELFH